MRTACLSPRFHLCPAVFRRVRPEKRRRRILKRPSSYTSKVWRPTTRLYHLPLQKNLSRLEGERITARFRSRGSHIILRRETYPHRRVVVPDHKEVAKGTLRSIIRETGLTVDEFKALL